MADILISVAAKVAEYLVAQLYVHWITCLTTVATLISLRNKLSGWARDEIEPDVQRWLTRTEGIIQTAKTLIEDEKAANTSCFNLKLRYQRSRQAKKQSGDICKMQEENKFPRVAYRPPPQGIWSPRLTDYRAFQSRESLLNEIMAALGNDDIRMIVAKNAEEDKLFEKVVMALNISQIPNVTKFRKILQVFWAHRLRRSLNKHKTVLVILDDIWEELLLDKIGIPCGDAQRGGVLSRMDGTKKIFHVPHLHEEEAWSLFKKTAGDSVEELKFIAIPVVRECAGLPVAIVTVAKALKGQSEPVWNNALQELKNCAPANIEGVHDKVYNCLQLSYDHLNSEEVKRLFLLCGMLGYGDISMDQLLKYGMGLDLFEHVSSLEQIRNKLVTLVKILKDSSLLLDAEDRYRPGVGPGVFFGYNDENKFVRMHDVVGDVARAIAAKDPHRFVVIKEALGLEEWQRKEEFRNCSRISLQCRDLRELPERLVCSKLEFFLLNGNDPSLRIPNTFFEETELLKVLDLSAMHLTPLPSSLGFLSNLRTLRVYRCTLQDMALIGELKKLQVLSFASCEIERLPKEFMQLTDLRALDLWGCSYLKVIPQNVISSLSRLEHLCLAKSFTKWGAEGFGSGESNNACLSELNNLSYLKTLCIEITDPDLLSKDLVFEKLTRYVISVSSRPGYVDHNSSARTLNLRRVNKPCLVDCFSKLFKTVEDLELYDLKDTRHVLYEFDTDDFLQLKHLVIGHCPGIQYIVDSTKGVPSHSAFPMLEELDIFILEKMDAVCYGPIPEGSFGKLRSLTVRYCKRLKSFISLPMEQGRDGSVLPEMGSLDSTRDFKTVDDFLQLKRLVIRDCPGIQYIVDSTKGVTLPSLEDLTMESLDNVIAMWHNQLPLESCCNFKSLEISKCNKALNVFPSNILKGLQSLKYVEIHDLNCEEIHEIATIPLEELTLERLNSLKSVWNKDPQGLVSFQNLLFLKVLGCPCLKYLFQLRNVFIIPKLTSLTLEGLDKLKGFYQGTRIARGPHLKKLVMLKWDQVGTLFQEIDSEGYIDSPIQQSFFLLEKQLILKGSKKKIWQDQFSGVILQVESFEDKRVSRHFGVIPCNMLPKLHNLKRLYVSKCNSVKEVFQMKELVNEEYQVETLHGGEEPYDIVFSKLQRLRLVNLQSLKWFCSTGYTFKFPSLEQFEMKRCPRMEFFVRSL
ncbi:hypothetical protein AAG906_007421 [Vitis piasezkii]